MKKYVKENLTLDEKVAIINAWETYRGAEGYEYVFDLEDTDDAKDFVLQYGNQTLSSCRKKARYWLGGLNFYADERNKCIGRETCIKVVDSLYASIILEKAVYPYITYTFFDFVHGQNTAKLIEKLRNDFGYLIDFTAMYNDKYKVQIFGRLWSKTDKKDDFLSNKDWWVVLQINGGHLYMNNVIGGMMWVDENGNAYVTSF